LSQHSFEWIATTREDLIAGELNMKTNRLLLAIVSSGLLTVATGSWAQDKVTHFTSSDGTKVTLTSGQPPPDHYGSAPNFGQLDTNHDGFISRDEAEAYPPLFNDFDFPAQHANRISKRQYEFWNHTQSR